MTDNPKRKRTLNRRRKFLLWGILPIVALILGFMALSPQIDAWLATDPFTPQCQFEQDRYFYVSTSLREKFGSKDVIASVNSTDYREIESADVYTWSPDGELFAYTSYGEKLRHIYISST